MELTQNLWERYGFTGNPFDTRALSLSKQAPLSIKDAYVERKEDAKADALMTNFLRNPGGGRILVEGKAGVGKTTFVNHHRYRWEAAAKHKLLSPPNEISVEVDWGGRDLLLALLAALSGRIRLDMGEKAFKQSKLLKEVAAVTSVHIENSGGFHLGGSLFGFGGSAGHSRSASLTVGDISDGKLREYLRGLLGTVKRRGFAGVIFHLNNLELLGRGAPEKIRAFFESARDSLQLPDVYFILVGYPGMFQQAIVPLPRVRSIFFDIPLHLEPLRPEQVMTVIERRYELLAVSGKQWIRPVQDDVVHHLCNLFDGRIRYVMNAVTNLICHVPDSYTGSLALPEAMGSLKVIMSSELRRSLQGAEERAFHAAACLQRFSNSDLVDQLGKSKQHIQKYLRHWLELGLVFRAEKEGRRQAYEVEPRFVLLREDSRRSGGRQ